MMGVLTQPRGKTSTRCTPDLTTFTRLDELGLEVVAQRVEPGQASLVCRVVAMDRFTKFKTAASEKLPTATTVMDPFHIARLAGNAPNQYRHRAQQELHRHHGRADDPLFRARRTPHTSTELLTEQQQIHLRSAVHRR